MSANVPRGRILSPCLRAGRIFSMVDSYITIKMLIGIKHRHIIDGNNRDRNDRERPYTIVSANITCASLDQLSNMMSGKRELSTQQDLHEEPQGTLPRF